MSKMTQAQLNHMRKPLQEKSAQYEMMYGVGRKEIPSERLEVTIQNILECREMLAWERECKSDINDPEANRKIHNYFGWTKPHLGDVYAVPEDCKWKRVCDLGNIYSTSTIETEVIKLKEISSGRTVILTKSTILSGGGTFSKYMRENRNLDSIKGRKIIIDRHWIERFPEGTCMPGEEDSEYRDCTYHDWFMFNFLDD